MILSVCQRHKHNNNAPRRRQSTNLGRVLIGKANWQELGLYRVPSPAAKADNILQRLAVEADGGEIGTTSPHHTTPNHTPPHPLRPPDTS